MVRLSLKPVASLALFLVFFGGEFGLPLMDAALEHRVSAHEDGRVHVEAAGNQLCHAESCILGLAMASSRQVTNAVSPSLAIAITAVSVTRHLNPTPPSSTRPGSYRSRAPPSFS